MGQNIVLVLRSGGDFKFRDVKLLASRILQPYRREGKEGPSVYCLCDTIADITKLEDVTLLPMENAWKGWWAKMNLFSPALEHLRPFLYMDLDTAVVDKIDKIFPTGEKANKTIILDDFYYPGKQNSSLMWLPKASDGVMTVWKRWIKSPEGHMNKYRGDQDFLFSTKAFSTLWQNFIASMITSFKPKRGQRLSSLSDGVVAVCFHGHPRIWEAVESTPWVRRYVAEGVAPKNSDDPLVKLRLDARVSPHPWFSALCPTWGRPDMAARYVESMYSTAIWPDKVEILLYVDEDDPLLPEYVRKTQTMQSRIIVGPSEGVGKAWNTLARASSGQYLIMGNDDLFCETWGWDRTLLQRFAKFPDGIFLAYTADGINKDGKRCCFPIISRRWFETVGEYVPEYYRFFFHDTELHDMALKLEQPERVLYYPDVMIRHNHANDNRPADPTHDRNRKANQNQKDARTFKEKESERKRKAFLLKRALFGANHSAGDVFENLVKGKRVALVGPSPHLGGSQIGKLIDKYDTVCRINEILPFGLEMDYGNRTDIVFHCCNQAALSKFEKGLARFQKEKKKFNLFMCAQRRNDPVVVYAEESFYRLLHTKAPEVQIGAINLNQWDFYSHWIGTHPNTGLLSLCMLANAQPVEIFLTGFSFYNQGGKPAQRHHKAYIEYGGDEKYNARAISAVDGHLQNPQKKWFVDHFLSVFGDLMVLDSYLDSILQTKWPRIVDVKEGAQ